MRYALLLAPSANREYADQAPRLAVAELAVFAHRARRSPVEDVKPRTFAGVDYLCFEAREPLTGRDVAYLSNLSGAYALFEVADQDTDGGAWPLLRPVELSPLAHYD